MVVRYNKPPSHRQLKVAEGIKVAISEIFLYNEMSHPFFEKHKFVATMARVSPDLKFASVFITIPKELDRKEVLTFFNKITNAIRTLLAKKMLLREVPRLEFLSDASNTDIQF